MIIIMFTICRAVAMVLKVMKTGVDNFHMDYYNNVSVFYDTKITTFEGWSDFRKKSFATLHRDVAIGVVLVP